MECDAWFNDLLFKEVYLVAHLLDKGHLILSITLVLYTEIASSKVLPPSISIKLVQFSSKSVIRSPIKLHRGIVQVIKIVNIWFVGCFAVSENVIFLIDVILRIRMSSQHVFLLFLDSFVNQLEQALNLVAYQDGGVV